ncbi:mammalian ependymin-related protein 1-like [Gigantopelta aegis]|uniref:mammalian ependymin-related protein 1-like n=1 Tax=Gigantopelta aegis TaxID=1735272 RepID=UPI001B888984|nr:mammalian ependymin-related protein 1-like [Gigantopelta aegis]
MFVVLVVTILALASGQTPKPCESPKEFEANFIRWDHERKWFQEARVAYDENNQRTREREELLIGSKANFYDILTLHKENKEYRLNLKTKTCNVTVPRRSFMPLGIPMGTKYQGSYVVGMVGNPNEQVTAATFEGTHEGNFFWGAVTIPSCVPLQYGVHFNSTGDGFHMTFYDLQIGIVDPNVWIPPKECLQ